MVVLAYGPDFFFQSTGPGVSVVVDALGKMVSALDPSEQWLLKIFEATVIVFTQVVLMVLEVAKGSPEVQILVQSLQKLRCW